MYTFPNASGRRPPADPLLVQIVECGGTELLYPLTWVPRRIIGTQNVTLVPTIRDVRRSYWLRQPPMVDENNRAVRLFNALEITFSGILLYRHVQEMRPGDTDWRPFTPPYGWLKSAWELVLYSIPSVERSRITAKSHALHLEVLSERLQYATIW